MADSTPMLCDGDSPARYEPPAMARIHREWCEYSPDHASLKQCFQFVKYKMNVVRDMEVIASDRTRLEFCVALFEYRQKILALSKGDLDFIARYEDGR